MKAKAATFLLALFAAGALAAGQVAWNRGVGAAADWPAHGGAADESGYSRLAEIDASNIGRLGLAWSLDLPGEVTLEATPLAVGGVLYFTGTYSAVYAVDGVTGKLLWKHGPDKMLLSFAASRHPQACGNLRTWGTVLTTNRHCTLGLISSITQWA